MSYKPGDTFKRRFTTHEPDTGANKNASSTPSAVLVRNGDDTAESVTVTNEATGDYSASGTIPAGWSAGDEIQLRITATVVESDDTTSVTASVFKDLGVLDTRAADLVSDLDDAKTAAEAASTEIGKVPRAAAALTAGGASRHERVGGDTDIDDVEIKQVP